MKRTIAIWGFVCLVCFPALAADAPPQKPAPAARTYAPPKSTRTFSPAPTLADVPYGKHQRQILSLWKAPSDKPTPAVIFIHGGAWLVGDQTGGIEVLLREMLKNGISVVAIDYRFLPEAAADGEIPPVRGPLHDAARALQFVRAKAAEWNIDKTRIGASGASAGACSSLWLAFHDDLADPQSEDPIARESTRLWCAAVSQAQTTLDPRQMKEWTPNSNYGGHAFGFSANKEKKTTQFDEFLAGRDTILPWIAEYSPYALVTADDPPVFMYYIAPPGLGQNQKDPTHTSNFGVKLQEHCRAVGVECELVYPGAPQVKHRTIEEFFIDKLKGPAAKKASGEKKAGQV